MLLILTEMQLKRFKKQKSPTQGKGTPLSSDHNPLQPWPFGSLHMPSTLLMFLILTYYTELYMVSITTKKIKKWSENAPSKIFKSKIFLFRERGIPSFGSPSQPQSFVVRHVPRILLMFSYSNLYLSFCKELCMVKLLQKR